MPYDTDNRSGITKNASESQKSSLHTFVARIFVYTPTNALFLGSPAKVGGCYKNNIFA